MEDRADRRMPSMKLGLGLILSSMACAAFADLPPYAGMDSDAARNMNDQQIDASFVCPETLDYVTKVHEVMNFMAWAKYRHPDWSDDDGLRHRYRLLVSHKCTETLRNINRSGPPSR